MAGGRTKPIDSATEKGLRTAQRNIDNNSLKINNLEKNINSIKVDIVNHMEWVDAPAATGAPGVKGQIAYTSTHLYICVSNNTWKRVAVSTW